MKILISWIQRVSTNAPPKELRAGTWNSWDLGGVSQPQKRDIKSSSRNYPPSFWSFPKWFPALRFPISFGYWFENQF